MSAPLANDVILLQSFETAAISVAPKNEAMVIPAPANSSEATTSSDSIFRTTEK